MTRAKRYFFHTLPKKINYSLSGKIDYLLSKKIDYEKSWCDDALYFFWDLECYGPSYDIVRSLAMAEIIKIELNKAYICIVIVPPFDGRFPQYIYGNLSPSESRLEKNDFEANYLLKLKNIFIPCCFLFKSCKSIYMCSSRNEAEFINNKIARHKLPKGYSIYTRPNLETSERDIMKKLEEGFEMPSIQAENHYCKSIEQWIESYSAGRKIITITLRESYRHPDRNSNINEWSRFIESLDKSVYFPVVIRDTEKSLTILPTELNNCTTLNEVSWNIGLRMALYEKSYLNLGVSNGPMILCLFNNKCKCIIYKFIPSSSIYTSTEFLLSAGLIPGGRYLMCNEFQKLVWEDDTYGIIAGEFKKMCHLIEHNSK